MTEASGRPERRELDAIDTAARETQMELSNDIRAIRLAIEAFTQKVVSVREQIKQAGRDRSLTAGEAGLDDFIKDFAPVAVTNFFYNLRSALGATDKPDPRNN